MPSDKATGTGEPGWTEQEKSQGAPHVRRRRRGGGGGAQGRLWRRRPRRDGSRGGAGGGRLKK
jgi:hypothetical protein